jgi:hypothetical protein
VEGGKAAEALTLVSSSTPAIILLIIFLIASPALIITVKYNAEKVFLKVISVP